MGLEELRGLWSAPPIGSGFSPDRVAQLIAKFRGTAAIPTEEITDFTGSLPGDIGEEDPGHLGFLASSIGRSVFTPIRGVAETFGLAEEGSTAESIGAFEKKQQRFLEHGNANLRAIESFIFRLSSDMINYIGPGAAAKIGVRGTKLALTLGAKGKAAQFLGGTIPGAVEGAVIGLGESTGAGASPAEKAIATTLGGLLGGTMTGLVRLKGGTIRTDPTDPKTHPAMAKLVSFVRSQGGKPQDVHDAANKGVHGVKGALIKVEQESRRFTELSVPVAAKAKTLGIPQEQFDFYVSNRLLEGKGVEDLDPLFQELVEPAKRLRVHIDEMSREIRASGLAGPEGSTLYDVIEKGEGGYVARTYAALESDFRDWPKRVMDTPTYDPDSDTVRSAWDVGVNYLREDLAREGISVTPRELVDLAHDLAVRDIEGFEAMSKSGKLVKQYTDLFKKRKDIPEPIRALMGQPNDPIARYQKTIMRQSIALEDFKFKRYIKDNHEGKLFWRSPSDVEDVLKKGGRWKGDRGDIVELPELETGVSRSVTEEGVGEVLQEAETKFYTTKTIRDVVFRADEQVKANAFQMVNSFSKVMATIYSPQTHGRNYMANEILLIMNGHSPHHLFTKAGRRAHRIAFQSNVGKKALSIEDQDFLVEAAKRGVVGEDTRAGDLNSYMDMMERLTASGDQTTTSKMAQKVLDNRTGKFAKGLYMAEDEVFKLTMWGREMDKYRVALPNLSESELMDMTAKIVRNQLPTYSQVPKLGEWLRKNPVGGTFVSFPMEIVRNTKNALRQGLTEIASDNLAIQKIGAKRLTGTMAAISLPGVIQQFYRMRSNAPTDLEEESLKAHVRPWDKSNQLVIQNIDRGTGDVSYFNTGFMDSLATLKEPILGALGGAFLGPEHSGAAGFARSIADTFLGPEIAMTAFIEVLSNRKGLPLLTGRQGGDVYSQEANLIDQWASSADHLRKAFTPGLIKSAERIARATSGTVGLDAYLRPFNDYGTEYKLGPEVLALMGPRLTTINVPNSMRFRISTFLQKRNAAKAVYNRADNPRKFSTPAQLGRARKQANEIYDKAFDELYLAVEASRNLGMADIEIVKMLRAIKLSRADVYRIMTGTKLSLITKSVVRRKGV